MKEKEDERELKPGSTVHHDQTFKSSKQIKSFSRRTPLKESVKLYIKRKIRHKKARYDPRHR